MTRAWGWVAAVLLGALSALAAEQAPEATLDYTYPPASDCYPRENLARAVAARLGREAFSASAVRQLEVNVAARAPRGYRATIRLRAPGRPEGERTLESTATGCTELMEQLAVALALAVDPRSAVGGPPLQTPPQKPSPPAAEAPVAASVEAPPLSLEATGRLAVTGAVVPVLNPELGLGLQVGRSGVRVRAMALGEVPVPRGLAQGAVWLHRFGLELGLCVEGSWLGGCVSTQAGLSHLWATGLAEAREYWSPSASTAVAAHVRVPVGRGALRVFLRAEVPWWQAQLYVGSARVWQAWPFGLSLGVEASSAALGASR